ncbi:MAG: hypothetical protein HN347_16175 [Bacteroidetes bacterium]|jgi:hypothetical protein|nr:hypothetical protein [Bacteroidota bacterium]
MNKLIETAKEIDKILKSGIEILPDGPIHEKLRRALNIACVTNPVKIIDWKYTETEKPLAYISGDWDGKNSDQVVAEDKYGKQYLAHYCEGFMDGSSFADWYENNDFLINEEIVRWMLIPL